MKRYQENSGSETYVSKVFTFLRGKSQGDTILVRDKHTDEAREVLFIRRGRINVSTLDPATNKSELYDLERVIIPEG